MDISKLPVLYSLRHCPYAMRARLCILLSGQTVLLRDVVMANKPNELLRASPKGTVPVLILPDNTVLEQSIDVMLWALKTTDPLDLLHNDHPHKLEVMLNLINTNDEEFISNLNMYKAASRYRDDKKDGYRLACEPFIQDLELRLENNRYLFGNKPSLADYAVLPFIRQFSRVDRPWFVKSPYLKLQHWLERLFSDPAYSKAMIKVPQWLDSQEDLVFNYLKK